MKIIKKFFRFLITFFKGGQKVVPNDDFESVFISELITIPDINIVVRDVKDIYRSDIGNVLVPEGLKTGIRKRVKIIRLKKEKSSQEVVDRLKKETGAILPNIFGLRIAEMICFSQLPKNMWIRGIDEKNNLLEIANEDRVVPSMGFGSSGGVSRDEFSWIGDWNIGHYFMVFCD